ncbi:hypothetical protein PROFUN_08659 [Planoprotostelium fungivorum]|uniref:Uncharacterized protein n=1 Tax=Planoprotostelium fungivorum TaxID=1890364 RepID=A0A2P6NJ41_9EUKA|nr:hypothetical protein PROFUN_08659 [Planoprotostelium fungivorum]
MSTQYTTDDSSFSGDLRSPHDELSSPFHNPDLPIIFHDDGSGRYSLTSYPSFAQPRTWQPPGRKKVRYVSIEIRSREEDSDCEEHNNTVPSKESFCSYTANKSIINPPLLEEYDHPDQSEPLSTYFPDPSLSRSRWQLNLSPYDAIRMENFPTAGSTSVTLLQKKYVGSWSRADYQPTDSCDRELGDCEIIVELREQGSTEKHPIYTHLCIILNRLVRREDSPAVDGRKRKKDQPFTTQSVSRVYLMHIPEEDDDDAIADQDDDGRQHKMPDGLTQMNKKQRRK